jgi:hypothetical protein
MIRKSLQTIITQDRGDAMTKQVDLLDEEIAKNQAKI